MYLVETKRLGLRTIDPESDNLYDYLGWLHDPRVTRFLENRFYPTGIESLTEYIKEKNESKSALLLGIHRKGRMGVGSDWWVGNIKLEPIDYIHRRGEIGIMIGDVPSWGHGYATEAIGALVEYAFTHLGLHRCTAGCYSQNQASLEAFRNNGFEIEGRYREHIFCEGQFHDEILLGLLQ